MKIRILTFLCMLLAFSPDFVYSKWVVTSSPTVPAYNMIYNASKNRIYAAMYGYGVGTSGNEGNSWVQLHDGLSTDNVYDIAFIDKSFLAATENGLFMSTNDGLKWKSYGQGFSNSTIYNLLVEGTNLYASTDEYGIYVSTDKGANWTNLNAGGDVPESILTIAATPGNVYVGTRFGRLYHTTNNGTEWINIASGIGFDIKSIAIKGSQIFIGTYGGGIYTTTNNGTNWSALNNGLGNSFVNQILIEGDDMYVATNGGVFYSDNNGTIWADVNEGLSASNILSLVSDGKYLYAGGADQPVYKRLLSEIGFPEVEPPVLLSPAADAEGIETTFTFSWNPSNGAVSYHFQLSESDDFGITILDMDGLKETFFSAKDLSKNKTYFWRVAANTANLEKKWSEVRKFSTVEDDIPVFPTTLLTPANDTINEIDMPFILKWNKADGAEGYSVVIAFDKEFEFIVHSVPDVVDTMLSVTNLGLHTVHFWKVISKGNFGKTAESPVGYFKTGIINSVDDIISQSENLSLKAYPNPANSIVNINLVTRKPGKINIVMIDVNGNMISKISDSYLDSGNSEFKLDVGTLSSGTYYIKVDSGSESVVKKIVVDK